MPVLLTDLANNGALTLTLNRPEVHNAINEELVSALIAELRRAEADPAVRVLVLAAAGRSFSAGIDLDKLRRVHAASSEEMLADTKHTATLMETLDTLSKPTIARVQGAAFAGGVGLIACCDIAVAAAGAIFGITEVRMGLAPLLLNPYLIRRMGFSNTRRLILTGERFDAREAQQMGLISEVTHTEHLSALVAKHVDLLRRASPDALAAAKASVTELGRANSAPSIEELVGRLARLRHGSAAHEGITAFLEKRLPAWAVEKQ